MDLETNKDINFEQLIISDFGGGGIPKIIDMKEVNEPFFVIQFSKNCHEVDIILKSMYQLIKMVKYKNILFCHENENTLETIITNLKSKFPDKSFFSAEKAAWSGDSHYKINFTSHGGATLHYEIQVVIGETKWTFLNSANVCISASDKESGTNDYSEDPHNPINKPWTVPPTTVTPTIAKVFNRGLEGSVRLSSC